MTEHEETKINKKRNPIARFFSVIWSLAKGYFMAIGLMVTLLPLLLILLVSRSQGPSALPTTPDIEASNVLKIKLDGHLSEKSPEASLDFFMRLLGEKSELYAPKYSRILEYASKDDRIKALFVDVNRLSGSMAQLSELRRAFKQFKDSGKPIHFHVKNVENSSYYISSLGSSINLTPAGSISLTGPVLSLMYFGEGLKKLGVEFEVFQAGKFKSAMENLVRNSPSEAARMMYNDLEANIRNQMIEDIAAARGTDIELVRGWMTQSMFIPKDALQAGIITDLEYRTDLEEKLKTKWKIDEFLKFSDYSKIALAEVKDDEIGGEDEKIAFIESVGEIHMYADGNNSDTVITPGNTIKKLKWALEEDDVRAVVLRISSPGGSATASDMIWAQVKKLAAKKPVVVSMMGYAASGGYYIASAGTKILSEPATVTGSIGVIGGIANLSAFSEKYGVSFHTFTETDRVALVDPGKKMTDFDRAVMTASIESTYSDFLDRVAEGRKMKKTQVHDIAQGRVWTGRQALELGLVDEIGGYQDAFQLAKELGGLDPKKKYRVATYVADELNFRDCIKSSRRMLECLRELESHAKTAWQKQSNMTPIEEEILRYRHLSQNLKEPLMILPERPKFF